MKNATHGVMKLICIIILAALLFSFFGAASASTVQVNIKSFQFQPSEVTIHPGDTVTWTNQDPVLHDVTFKDKESPDLSKGGSYSMTFSDPGTFDYLCTIHPTMKGKVIVK